VGENKKQLQGALAPHKTTIKNKQPQQSEAAHESKEHTKKGHIKNKQANKSVYQ